MDTPGNPPLDALASGPPGAGALGSAAVPVSRRTLALLAATLLAGGAAPAVAPAQTVPAPEELPPLQQLPDSDEPAPEPPPAEEPQEHHASGSSSDRPRATELADTGSDPRVVALLGFTALLTGVGLRLRTAPERF